LPGRRPGGVNPVRGIRQKGSWDCGGGRALGALVAVEKIPATGVGNIVFE